MYYDESVKEKTRLWSRESERMLCRNEKEEALNPSLAILINMQYVEARVFWSILPVKKYEMLERPFFLLLLSILSVEWQIAILAKLHDVAKMFRGNVGQRLFSTVTKIVGISHIRGKIHLVGIGTRWPEHAEKMIKKDEVRKRRVSNTEIAKGRRVTTMNNTLHILFFFQEDFMTSLTYPDRERLGNQPSSSRGKINIGRLNFLKVW